MMRISHVEVFRAVMLTGSTTAAARMLNMSQPNVSRAIAHLERAAGLTLFERSPGKLQPTKDGNSFFREVQRSFVGLQRLEDTARRLRRFSGEVLRIGAIQTLALGLIPRAIESFTRVYPEAGISIQAGHSTIVSQWVDENSCDFGLVSHVTETYGLESEVLYQVEGVCLMPQQHRLAEKEWIEPEDLEGEPYISFSQNDFGRSQIDRIFETCGINRQITLETPHSPITCALVARGLGVAIVNPIAARDFMHLPVVAKPFRPVVEHSATLIYPRGQPADRLVRSFVQTLKEVTAEQLQS